MHSVGLWLGRPASACPPRATARVREADLLRSAIMCGAEWEGRPGVCFTRTLVICRSIIPRLSAVLISHADIEHVGALPYLVAQFGLSCPVYMTFPVFRMGQVWHK